jgi:fibronectin type 3 domain-containing protein
MAAYFMQVYAVKTHAKGGELSTYSNYARLIPRTPPAPPTALTVEEQPHGVALGWTAPAGGNGFAVYRRLAASHSYGAPLATVGKDVHQFVDSTAKYGDRYIYTVTAVAWADPRVESGLGEEREVDYQDRFPPAAPEGLEALAQQGGVNLVWQASVDTDTVGYHVYRQDPGQPWRRLDEKPITDLRYIDGGLTKGLRYRYRVTAVDNVGNEGPPTPEAEAVPR